ncbi:MAG: hypothetical protein BWY79_00102 [Actinobacteria bacterium ADurb.Bin444]|nr:MAG: hypothetical protein BWY79_00102 [Actinobacteria bacterium ADurb.Bin444]
MLALAGHCQRFHGALFLRHRRSQFIGFSPLPHSERRYRLTPRLQSRPLFLHVALEGSYLLQYILVLPENDAHEVESVEQVTETHRFQQQFHEPQCAGFVRGDQPLIQYRLLSVEVLFRLLEPPPSRLKFGGNLIEFSLRGVQPRLRGVGPLHHLLQLAFQAVDLLIEGLDVAFGRRQTLQCFLLTLPDLAQSIPCHAEILLQLLCGLGPHCCR